MGHICITVLWISLTTLLSCSLVFTMLSPAWIQRLDPSPPRTFFNNETNPDNNNNSAIVSFGLLRFCEDGELEDMMTSCAFYDGIVSMPTIFWLVCAVLYSLGVSMLFLSVVMATCGVFISRDQAERLRIAISYVQAVAVFFLCLSILVYPLGFRSEFARSICGERTNYYVIEQCHVTWGYVLAIMTVSMTIFCPILAKLSAYRKDLASMRVCNAMSTGSTTLSHIMTTV